MIRRSCPTPEKDGRREGCKRREIPRLELHADEKGKGRGTHLANDLAQQEEVQLAEDKQNRSQDVIPHRAHFIQHPEHDVGHEQQVDDRRAAGGMETTKQTKRPCQLCVIHHSP